MATLQKLEKGDSIDICKLLKKSEFSGYKNGVVDEILEKQKKAY